jgi:hypothetical protein
LRIAPNWRGFVRAFCLYNLSIGNQGLFWRLCLCLAIALVLIDWLADRRRRADTSIPNVPAGWSLLSSDIKIRSAMANESPQGTALLLDESFLPGDIKYESPKGNVRIYFPIVTAIILSILFTLILRLISKASSSD